MKEVTLDALVDAGAALAHPGRLRILALLGEGGLYVCQIRSVLGFAASTASAHLAVLRRAGLVSEEKFGRWVQYHLTGEQPIGSVLREILLLIRDDRQVTTDAALLAAVRRVPVDRLCRAGLDLATFGITGPGCRRGAAQPALHGAGPARAPSRARPEST